jgi:effector-binding domain-containing protein
MDKEKIFIISLHKTGTTSVSHFLEKLGYLVTGPDTHLFEKALNSDFVEINKFLEKYDVFQDDPWYLIYPYLDEKFKNAKFIFLKRDINEWINSVQKFYKEDQFNNKVRLLFYGKANTIKYKGLYLKKYKEHNKSVKEYFKDRKNFIEIDVSKDDDAYRLQLFLKKEIKFNKFPKKNARPTSKKDFYKKKIINFLKNWFGMKFLVKLLFKKSLSKESYLDLRTRTRFMRAKLRVFANGLFN